MVDDDALDQRLRGGAQPACPGDRGDARVQRSRNPLPTGRRPAARAVLPWSRPHQSLLPGPARPALARALGGGRDPARGGIRLAPTRHCPVSLVDRVQPVRLGHHPRRGGPGDLRADTADAARRPHRSTPLALAGAPRANAHGDPARSPSSRALGAPRDPRAGRGNLSEFFHRQTRGHRVARWDRRVLLDQSTSLWRARLAARYPVGRGRDQPGCDRDDLGDAHPGVHPRHRHRDAQAQLEVPAGGGHPFSRVHRVDDGAGQLLNRHGRRLDSLPASRRPVLQPECAGVYGAPLAASGLAI